jgi:hypothetical protein
MKLTALEAWKCVEDRGHEWLEVHHPVGGNQDEKYPEEEFCDVLLELDALIHGDEGVVFAPHTPKKITVLDASPAAPNDGRNGMPCERCGEI